MGHRQVQTKKAATKSSQPPNRRRWLAATLVVAAVLLVLSVKMLRTRPPGGLSVAETSAAATMPALDVSPAAPAAQPTVSQPQSALLPADPAEQVDWVLQNKKPALILFHSTNCKPCIAMTALVQQIRPAYAGEVVFIDVITNDAANAALIRRAGIQSIPTTFFITSSGSGQGYVGLMKQEDVRAELDKLVSPG